MRASLVLGGAGTISGIASTTCGGDHVRVRRACLRCPHALLPCTALLSKRIKGDSFACAAGRGSAQSHRRCGRPKIGHARRWFNRDSQSSNALSAQRLAWREQPPRLSLSSDIHDQSERSLFGRRPHRISRAHDAQERGSFIAMALQWHCNAHDHDSQRYCRCRPWSGKPIFVTSISSCALWFLETWVLRPELTIVATQCSRDQKHIGTLANRFVVRWTRNERH